MNFVRKLMVSALAAAAVMCASCATLEANPNTVTLVTEYAVAKVIEVGKTSEERLTRATRIKKIAGDAQTWLNGEGVTIDILQIAAQVQIEKLNLDVADTILANALVQTIVQDLQKKIGAGVIPPDKLTKVNELLGWVVTACTMYGA